VLLAARRAAVEVSAQTGDRRVDVFPRELELDVAVELLEAHLAADVRLGGTEEPDERLLEIGGSIT
jgi:hypothetical protein